MTELKSGCNGGNKTEQASVLQFPQRTTCTATEVEVEVVVEMGTKGQMVSAG